MIRFLKAFVYFLMLYMDGYYFSGNIHRDSDKVRWGFYRFNHTRVPAIFDIDFMINPPGAPLNKDGSSGHATIHGSNYRIIFGESGKVKRWEKQTWTGRG